MTLPYLSYTRFLVCFLSLPLLSGYLFPFYLFVPQALPAKMQAKWVPTPHFTTPTKKQGTPTFAWAYVLYSNTTYYTYEKACSARRTQREKNA